MKKQENVFNRWENKPEGRYEARESNRGHNFGNSSSKPPEKYISLSICGHCKTDTSGDYDNRTEKVIEYDFADMLCGNCRRKMRNEMVLIAMEYLDNQ